jgi:hypothetical protein
MRVCDQCKGSGKVAGPTGQPLTPPNAYSFTDVTTGSEYQCPSCLGTGKMNAFGAS